MNRHTVVVTLKGGDSTVLIIEAILTLLGQGGLGGTKRKL